MIGRIITDLAPTPQNRRNSEGAFINLKNGDILFAYSHYAGKSWADDADADLHIRKPVEQILADELGEEGTQTKCTHVQSDGDGVLERGIAYKIRADSTDDQLVDHGTA